MKYFLSLLALTATSVTAFAPAALSNVGRTQAVSPVVKATASSEEFYIDEERRFIMNVLMVGAGGVVVAGFGIPFVLFFVPPGSGGGSGGVTAKDALGNDILAKEYLASKPAGDRSLAQGLKGDAT
jgi:cytochrome b6-f complex iron-sulfur subunit